ncbi:hypothetical protein [Sphingobacterium bovistauri]|uniref:hypothetical protein n=1 Tax=Sphingobacterium bovistauri TaxID=2781959 RepID=UPI001CE0A794|nr:hypothetical protein [Sphingobacterium bovistauri]
MQYCEDHNIDAWIPNFGQYKPDRLGFFFNADQDRYECIQEGGNKAMLPFKGISEPIVKDIKRKPIGVVRRIVKIVFYASSVVEK